MLLYQNAKLNIDKMTKIDSQVDIDKLCWYESTK